MSWLRNHPHDRELLAIVLSLVDDLSIPEAVKRWSMEIATNRPNRTWTAPQLTHTFGTVEIDRPAPVPLNDGCWKVRIAGHSIVPSLRWRRAFRRIHADRMRRLAAMSLSASFSGMLPGAQPSLPTEHDTKETAHAA